MITDQSVIDRFLAKINKTDKCWIWTGSTTKHRSHPRPYGQMWIDGKNVVAHKISFLIFNGDVPYGHDVCHKCDVTLCVNPEHLFTGTRSENMQDSINKGRNFQINSAVMKGGKIKLTADDVIRIREINDLSTKQIAELFNVTPDTIRKIKQRISWKKI